MPGRAAALRRRPAVARGTLRHAAMALLALAWLVPTVGLLVNSFRPERFVGATGWWTALRPPWSFTLQNYATVLSTYHIGWAFLNSLVIAVPGTIVPVLVATLAAYALTWMWFPGRRAVLLTTVGLLVVPLQLTLVPAFALLSRVGLVGTLPAAWLAHTAYGLPLAIYLLRNAMSAIPPDLVEAAALDGAAPLLTLVRVVVPLTLPVVASLGIFQFLWVWNDLLVALIFVGGRPDVAPLTVAVSNLANSLGQDWEILTAAAFLSMALPLTVFLVFQRFFTRGALAGALKG